jgi:hypothetical protein
MAVAVGMYVKYLKVGLGSIIHVIFYDVTGMCWPWDFPLASL